MKIKQSQKHKELKEALAPAETPELKPQQIKMFVNQLRMATTDLYTNLNQYADANQMLMELQGIQQLTQQIIASINTGTRKTTVTPQQMVQQTREVAKMKAPQQAPVQAPQQ